jgi:probable F420-dependent oxidoreductase
VKFVCSLAFTDPGEFCELAREADANGWEAIAVSDHVVHPARIESPYPYSKDGSLRWSETTPWPDPWVAIAAMAAVTTRLRFLSYVYVLPLRHPFLVAKTVGTAAVMSGDRIALGLGVGWMADEFRLLGQDFHTRGRRTDEMIEILRKLWTGERVEHHGACYDFAPLRMLPAPARPVPLLVGGVSEPALRRAARLGDGWLSDIHTTAELRGIVARLRAYRAEYGREQAPFSVVAACSDAFDVDGYRRAEDAGVTHLNTMPWLFYGGSSLQEKKAALRRFADQVIAKLA